MTPSASPQRVVCTSCGANNFATQAACWKCGASLSSPPPTAPNSVSSPASGSTPSVNPSPYAAPVHPPTPPVDPGTASRAAAALGLLFPWAAIPAGMIFLMLDDRRRAQIGRTAIVWGIIGTILHTIATGIFVIAPIRNLMAIASAFGRGAGASRDPLDGQDPQSEVPPLRFPGAGPAVPPTTR